ncbi:RNA-binding protein MEX3A-like [Scleropages formosus]|uniref:RNA-binding protein MEX3A-like n=1 Tax=Scleropages formosus TaxID=113540 RepID=A0A0P7V4P5_SCLFO|nr:RNA-binding protein MEX3A-like [Scleropages formosus]
MGVGPLLLGNAVEDVTGGKESGKFRPKPVLIEGRSDMLPGQFLPPGICHTCCWDEKSLRSISSIHHHPPMSLSHVPGCKIKALRAKTNTYIKTPVRGEEPVFLITGRKEDVSLARREIISAAEHFSMLRASRNKLGVSFGGSPPAPLPGQTTIQVRVPYRVVGLVVGPKGSTIKRIQQQTCTYIVTPSRDRDPVFEITGSPSNAERAREEIESHIAFRTGGLHDLNNENDCLGPEGGGGGGGGGGSGGGLDSRLQHVRLSPGLPEPGSSTAAGGPPHAQARRAHSEPISASAGFPGRLPAADSPPAAPRDCMTCFESKVTAALVPCGHNLFCMECAIRICELSHPECPVCHALVTQAIRIFS